MILNDSLNNNFIFLPPVNSQGVQRIALTNKKTQVRAIFACEKGDFVPDLTHTVGYEKSLLDRLFNAPGRTEEQEGWYQSFEELIADWTTKLTHATTVLSRDIKQLKEGHQKSDNTTKEYRHLLSKILSEQAVWKKRKVIVRAIGESSAALASTGIILNFRYQIEAIDEAFLLSVGRLGPLKLAPLKATDTAKTAPKACLELENTAQKLLSSGYAKDTLAQVDELLQDLAANKIHAADPGIKATIQTYIEQITGLENKVEAIQIRYIEAGKRRSVKLIRHMSQLETREVALIGYLKEPSDKMISVRFCEKSIAGAPNNVDLEVNFTEREGKSLEARRPKLARRSKPSVAEQLRVKCPHNFPRKFYSLSVQFAETIKGLVPEDLKKEGKEHKRLSQHFDSYLEILANRLKEKPELRAALTIDATLGEFKNWLVENSERRMIYIPSDFYRNGKWYCKGYVEDFDAIQSQIESGQWQEDEERMLTQRDFLPQDRALIVDLLDKLAMDLAFCEAFQNLREEPKVTAAP